MGAGSSSIVEEPLTPTQLREAREQLLERAAETDGVDADGVDALLKKLGPLAIKAAAAEALVYSCRSLQDADVVAFGMLTMLQPGGLQIVTSINLGHNSIGDGGAVALCKAIATGAPALRRLQLHENRIGDAGMAALARSMLPGGAVNLQNLKVDFNRIGDEGMRALAAVWAEGGAQELNELLAAGNEITSAGLAALAAQIDAAPKLKMLGFGSSSGGNRIGDDGAHALAQALHRRPPSAGILTVNLKTNLLTADGEQAIDAALKLVSGVVVLDSLRRNAASKVALRSNGETLSEAPAALTPVREEAPAGATPSLAAADGALLEA